MTDTRVAPLLLILLCACTASPGPAQRASKPRRPEPEFTTVLKGTSGFRAPVREVVRTAGRWRTIRDSLHVPKSSSEPAIDFGRDMLLVAAGPLSGVGDSVVISGITASAQAKRVLVVRYQGCLNPAQLATMPFHVVRVPHDSASVVFEEQVVRDARCGK